MTAAPAAPSAPPAQGPYRPAVSAGGLVFASGQIPLDPATGTFVEGGIEAQVDRAVENLRLVLEAAGTSLDRVVKTTLYLVSMDDFEAANRAYARRFGAAPPARTSVAVAALPKGARVEIDAVALAGS